MARISAFSRKPTPNKTSELSGETGLDLFALGVIKQLLPLDSYMIFERVNPSGLINEILLNLV